MKRLYIAAAAFVILFSAIAASAQTKRVNVRFRAGASEATYSNTVTGYGSVDHYVTARGGQKLTAKLTSGNSALYFVILKDLKTMEAVADDARDATEWSGDLPADGTYIVRVFLFRSEARRNKRPVKFSLKIRVD